MIEKVRCIDANAKQLAIISNDMLKKSKNLTKQAYEKGFLSSHRPRFTQESVKEFYNINDFYEKNGEIKETAKPVFAQILQDFGLHKNATLEDFRNYVLGVYR